MLTIVTAYKTGGDYTIEYVAKLAGGCKRHFPRHRFLCMTDAPKAHRAKVPGVGFFSLKHGWPGWWSKMELFRFAGQVIALDLDTVIVGPVEGLPEAIEEPSTALYMLGSFRARRKPQSGIMAWHGDRSDLFRSFEAADKEFQPRAKRWQLRANGAKYRGDEDWIREHAPEIRLVQKAQPGVLSFKRNELAGGLPEGARIVCFHGKPRPHEVTGVDWMKEHWA